MNSDRPHENSENNILQTVTALRNSWVVCKSKSHIGRIYYFNTLTGEAAWNLSDAEIEKANKRTKILQNQPGSMLESCPEPKDPPNDNVPVYKKDTLPLCSLHDQSQNEGVKKNQFLKHQHQVTPFLNNHCVTCNSINTSCTMNMQPAQTAYNPNIWTIPPHHQLVIAPTTPLINQNPTSLNVAYNNLEQHVSVRDTSLPFLKRLKPYQDNRSNRNLRFGKGIKKFVPRKNNNVSQRHHNFNGPATSNDLREILTAKKSHNWKNMHDNNQDKGNYKTQAASSKSDSGQKIQIIKPATEELNPNDADDSWLKEHAHVEGAQLKLNVKPLKDIIMLDANKCYWYIVADSFALLNHFNLINIVVNSDEHCQLMVPDETMAELQMISRSDDTQLMTRAHLVLRLLSQQFTTGGAVIGKDSSSDSKSVNIVEFTTKLAEQNHNVVIVSNNIEANRFENSGVQILKTEQLKSIITSTPILPKGKPHVSPDASQIHITTSNDFTMNFNPHTSERTKNDSNIEDEVSPKHVHNEATSKKNILKNMGVQTEIEPEENVTSFSETCHTNNVAVNSMVSNSNKICEQANTLDNVGMINKTANDAPKRREIRLKRNTSQLSANQNENNMEKKQFKWRRRKKEVLDKEIGNQPTTENNNFTDSNIAKPNPDPTINDDEVTDGNACFNELNEDSTPKVQGHQDDNHSETTTGSCVGQKHINEKVFIDETSNSAISNSVSNADTESSYSMKQNSSTNINNENFEQSINKCVMFEVENSLMEDRLKMRSDEWWSRFVQIMEETLTQVLRLDPPFHHRSLPPPWTLHEATECVKRKFHTDSDVTDAATKLTDVLYRNSDNRGKVYVPLKPTTFMEIYSYAVYLVDSLQAVITNCEDLQTAADSLAKLLAEIQDPNSCSSNNDSFIEEVDDPSANDTLCSSVANSYERESDSTHNTNKDATNFLQKKPTEKPTEDNSSNSDKRYNLRSNQKKSNEIIAEPQEVKFIRKVDAESTFFSFLQLQRNKVNADSTPLLQDKEDFASDVPIPENVIENQDSTNEPKIIRHFTTCLEFEERLKNAQAEENLDAIDYAEDEQEEYGYYDDEYNYDYDYYSADENEDASEMKVDDEVEDKDEVDKNDSYDFKWIIGKISTELQQALIQVHNFCMHTREELINASEPLNPVRKLQIREQAEAAQLHLDNMIKSLNSIIFREDKENGLNIQTMLHEIGVFLDSCQAVQYRNIIAKAKDQASILLESVNIVLEAMK